MPIPNLGFLDRLAGRADAAIARSVSSSMSSMTRRSALRGAGPVGRWATHRMGPAAGMAVKMAGPAASFAGRTAIAGGAAALSVGAAAATAAVGLSYIAARTFNAALNTPTIGPGGIDRGGSMLTWQKHGKIPFTNRHVFSPIASRRMSDMIGGTAVGAGIIGGINDASKQKGWNVTEALSSGALEVERDNFMGATGSLTLSMYKNRRARPTLQDIRQGTIQEAAMHMDRTEMVHALHMAHMAVGG